MSLADYNLVFQADRKLIERAIQERCVIYQSLAIAPPFQLTLPAPPTPSTGPASTQPRMSPLDLIFKSAELELTPGGDTGTLLLNIHLGVIRIPNQSAVPLNGGRLKLSLKFAGLTFFSVQWTGATFDLPVSPFPGFAEQANELAKKVIEKDLERKFTLFDMPDQLEPVIKSSTVRVIDAQTVAVLWRGSDAAAVTRFIASGHDLAAGAAANYIRGRQLCRSLLLASERDPAWNDTMFGPTANEMAVLPKGHCGTGEQSRSKDGVDVKITELSFDFRSGYIDVSGKFNAEDTCWSVEGGTFSQKLYLDYNLFTGQVLPRLEPKEPVLDYDVILDFLCELAAFGLGLIPPIVGGVLLGVGSVIAANIAAEMFNPPLDPQPIAPFPIPPIPNATWMRLDVEPEGMFTQGTMHVPLPAGNLDPLLWFTVTEQPHLLAGLDGRVTYAPPMCSAREFEYTEIIQDDHKVLKAGTKWMIEPVEYEWWINGQKLPAGKGALAIVTTVRTALPPPSGIDVPGSQVALGYDTGLLLGTLTHNPSEITLSSRHQDLNYWIVAELRGKDALGRTLSSSLQLNFIGDYARFGKDYYDYLNECLDKMGSFMDEKGRKARKPRLGEPQFGLDKFVQFAIDHIQAGNLAVAEFMPELIKAHGIGAVNEAFASKAVKKVT